MYLWLTSTTLLRRDPATDQVVHILQCLDLIIPLHHTPPALGTQLIQCQVVKGISPREVIQPREEVILSPIILIVNQALQALLAIPRTTINILRVLPDMTHSLEGSLLAQAIGFHHRS